MVLLSLSLLAVAAMLSHYNVVAVAAADDGSPYLYKAGAFKVSVAVVVLWLLQSMLQLLLRSMMLLLRVRSSN